MNDAIRCIAKLHISHVPRYTNIITHAMSSLNTIYTYLSQTAQFTKPRTSRKTKENKACDYSSDFFKYNALSRHTFSPYLATSGKQILALLFNDEHSYRK